MEGLYQTGTTLDHQMDSNPYRIMRSIVEAQMMELLQDSQEYQARVALLNHLTEEEKAKTTVNE